MSFHTVDTNVSCVAAADHKKSDKDVDTPKEGTERSKSKRRSIFGIFDKSDKAKSPNTEKKESEVVPAAGATTGATGATGEAKKVEQKATDAFKHDPVSAEDSATTATPAAGAATSEAKAEGVKSEEATSPAASKRTSILGSVFRRPSKQAKNAPEDLKKKEATNTPATVPETTDASKPSAATEAVPTSTTNATSAAGTSSQEPAIGDVVPDAVTVGHPAESEAAKPLSTTA